MIDKYDIAIVGGGSAGIMAAISASQIGNTVALIEKNPQVGRKLLATGNGRCNLTNRHLSIDCYHGAKPEFTAAVLNQFDQHETMAFFQDLGLLLKEEDAGRIFPRTNQASSVVEVLRLKLIENGVHTMVDSQVRAIEKKADWKITLADGRKLKADRLILATGGRAAHTFGSTGDGLYWAEKLGHTITPIYPALVPMETVEQWPNEAQGIKVEARVSATSDGMCIQELEGDVLFTSYGVSGPAVMGLARSIAPLMNESHVQLHIDLFPEMSREVLYGLVSHAFQHSAIKTSRDALIGILPSGLIPVVLQLAHLNATTPAGDVSKSKLSQVVDTLKSLTLTVAGLRRLKEAQVTAGGVVTDEIDPRSLESRLVKGLFFAGEIMDVDGDSGGFNLQWAWSSGYVAGLSLQIEF